MFGFNGDAGIICKLCVGDLVSSFPDRYIFDQTLVNRFYKHHAKCISNKQV